MFAEDIARGCILALDKGVSGERYMLDGQPEDVVSIANACNRMCELAGLDHEVVDIEPSDDPELAKVFGPTLVAIAAKAADGAHRTGASSRTPRHTSGWATTRSASTTAWAHDARVVPRDRQARQAVAVRAESEALGAVTQPSSSRFPLEPPTVAAGAA